MTDTTEHTNSSENKAPESSGIAPVPFFTQHRIRIAVAAVALAALLGGVFFAKSFAVASLNQDQTVLDRALPVSSITLKAVTHYQVKQKYSGSIVASRESDHGFDTGGLLTTVFVDEGDLVKKGDILARLDMRRLDAKAKELEAALAETIALNLETTARLDRAQATYDRYTVLVNQKHVSQEKFDQVKFDLIALKAHKLATRSAVDKSEAALKGLNIDRDMASLTARFDGSVIRRYLDEGTAIGSGTPIIRLIEDNKLEIHVGLPLSATFTLAPGQTHIFTYQGKQITTKLRTILKRIDQSTRTITAIFDVTDNAASIRAGGLAQLSIDTDVAQPGFWLPSGALTESRRGLWSVYTLKPYKDSPEYSTLSRQELQVIYTETDRIFVRGTIQDGDRIVSGGIHRLVPGQLVRIAEEN